MKLSPFPSGLVFHPLKVYFFESKNGAGTLVSKSGLNMSEYDKLLANGYQIMSWITYDYLAPRYSSWGWYLPNGTYYKPITNLHCVLVTGQGNGKYEIADAINGWQYVDKNTFWNCFVKMGKRAVVIA